MFAALGDTVQRVNSKAVVASQMHRAWSTKFFGTTDIFVANIMNERWAIVEVVHVPETHGLKLFVYPATSKLGSQIFLLRVRLADFSDFTLSVDHSCTNFAFFFASGNTVGGGDKFASTEPVMGNLLCGSVGASAGVRAFAF